MLLLTSYTIWAAHHQSNAADDLLAAVIAIDPWPGELHYLRQLPVDFEAAPAQIITTLQRLQPDGIVLCGMAEDRSHLSVESNGRDRHHPGHILHTTVAIEPLITDCTMTQISHDAGQFVCSHTYYQVLRHLDGRIPCIFVHVPILTLSRRSVLITDFIALLAQMKMVLTPRSSRHGCHS